MHYAPRKRNKHFSATHRALPAIGAALILQGIQLPPPPRGFAPNEAEVVADAAGVLSGSSVERINQIAFDINAKSGGEIAVVMLPDIGQYDVADVALQIGRQWKVGKLGDPGDPRRNAGAVILVVPKETSSDDRGRCFVASGRGIEGFITDGEAGAICREATPLFRARDYSRAMELVTLRVGEQFAREFGFSLDTSLAPALGVGESEDQAPQPRRSGRSSRGIPLELLFLLFVIFLMFVSASGRRSRRRRSRRGCLPFLLPIPLGGRSRGGWGGGWGGGGGGFGGGFGGFGGGGGFSGGGGGSSW